MFFLLTILVAHAAAPFSTQVSGWEKWDVECHERSLRYRQKTPTELLDAVCAVPSGNLGKYQMSYRQLHGVVAEAFLAKNAENRNHARRMLASYKCENEIACDNYRELLEAHDRGPEVKQNPATLKWSKQTRAKMPKRSPKSTTKVTGLCSPTSERTYWLERIYELYCPLKPTASNDSGCATLIDAPKSCSTTEAVREELETMSGQSFMSSSYLSNFAQEGMHDCAKKWKVVLTCGPNEVQYRIECEKTNRRVKCKTAAR